MPCLLCQSSEIIFLKKYLLQNYYQCHHCGLIFVHPADHIDGAAESQRYHTHENDPSNKGYSDFLSQVVSPLKPFLNKEMTVVDWGSGAGKPMQYYLKDDVKAVDSYDPIFALNQLNFKKYDVVIATEVVEHFRRPLFMWQEMIERLAPFGRLCIMTGMSDDYLPAFFDWYYIQDPTHICFYQTKTFDWIANKFSLRVEKISKNVYFFSVL